MSTFILWYALLMGPIGALSTVAQIGKPRNPVTSGAAAVTVLISISLSIMAALALFGGK